VTLIGIVLSSLIAPPHKQASDHLAGIPQMTPKCLM
jgi:hypothetical protein